MSIFVNKLKKNAVAVLFFTVLMFIVAIYCVLMFQNFNAYSVVEFIIIAVFGAFVCYWYGWCKITSSPVITNDWRICYIMLIWHFSMFVIFAGLFIFNCWIAVISAIVVSIFIFVVTTMYGKADVIK